jgi:hypothetical protein
LLGSPLSGRSMVAAGSQNSVEHAPPQDLQLSKSSWQENAWHVEHLAEVHAGEGLNHCHLLPVPLSPMTQRRQGLKSGCRSGRTDRSQQQHEGADEPWCGDAQTDAIESINPINVYRGIKDGGAERRLTFQSSRVHIPRRPLQAPAPRKNKKPLRIGKLHLLLKRPELCIS